MSRGSFGKWGPVWGVIRSCVCQGLRMSGVLPPRDHDEWIVSLGSYVEDIDFQRRGRVTALFETFDTTGMNIDWLAYQSRHVNEAQFKAPGPRCLSTGADRRPYRCLS